MGRTDVITYYGSVCEYGVGKLIEITLTAISQGTTEIRLHLDSQGGDLYAAFSAYEHLRSLNTRLITHNLNRVEDDALLLYLAGEERSAAPDACWALSSFDSLFGTGSLKPHVAMLRGYCNKVDQERFAKIFDARCHNCLDVCDRFIHEDPQDLIHFSKRIMGVADAMDVGIMTLAPAPTILETTATHWHITPGSASAE